MRLGGTTGWQKEQGIVIFSTEKSRQASILSRIFCTPAFQRVEFVSNRMLYIDMIGRWCNIFVLNGQASSEEKFHDFKDSFMRN